MGRKKHGRKEKWCQSARKNSPFGNPDFAFSNQFNYITTQLVLVVEQPGKIYAVSLHAKAP